MSSPQEIIVSIDFGTTFSGIAWGETNAKSDPRQIKAIERWPSSLYNLSGKECKKVPTRLRYTESDGIQWGFQIPSDTPDAEISEWFKLDLDPSLQPIPDVYRRAKSGTNATIGVDKLVTDYISALHKHLMYTLAEQRLKGAETIPLRFVITVPALWTDMAKSRITTTCQVALGLDPSPKTPIRVVTEPEAAAVYSFFVICDAGGGTVDLISYTIKKLEPILDVEEAAEGVGSVCGPVTVNWRFADYLRRKLGHLEGFDEFLSAAMENFENKIKPEFTLEDLEKVYPLPGLPFLNNIQKQRGEEVFVLKTKDLHDIFEPAIAEVIKIVNNQITQTKVPIRAVVLVGGFGSSNYLIGRLRNAVDEGIQVLRPHEAWLAVAYGAVMTGLNTSQSGSVRVTGRRARKHYGVTIGTPYIEKLHGHIKHLRWTHPLYDGWRITVIDWFIKNGDQVVENQPFLHHYTWSAKVPTDKSGCESFSNEILINETSDRAPLIKDGNTTVLCKLLAGLSTIPTHLLPTKRGTDGKDWYVIPCTIEVVFRSAITEYTFIYQGKRYGKVTAEYV